MADKKGYKPELIKTKYGFYQYSPLPSIEELREYYANKYYQQGLGSYSVSYTDEEIQYFKLKAWLIYTKVSQLIDIKKEKRFIDIGCGEGWVLNEFSKKGHCVQGLDFSKWGIEKFHPHLLGFFEQGNVFELLNKKTENGIKYDVLLLANVIEHVVDPENLLKKIKELMTQDSLLIIVAPNDFSPLHEYLISHGIITKKFWLCYPDHLSYFNKESMTNLLIDMGFKLNAVIADNPIDLSLLNDNSNYIEDPSKGKNTHLFRVRTDNFWGGWTRPSSCRCMRSSALWGVGRDLTFYCTIER